MRMIDTNARVTFADMPIKPKKAAFSRYHPPRPHHKVDMRFDPDSNSLRYLFVKVPEWALPPYHRFSEKNSRGAAEIVAPSNKRIYGSISVPIIDLCLICARSASENNFREAVKFYKVSNGRV